MIGDQGRMTTGMPERYDTSGGAPTPSSTPIKPPEADMTVVSIKNCSMISRRCAPKARRMPISRVRSETVASMMFMMPIPPTRSEMLAIEPSTRLKIL